MESSKTQLEILNYLRPYLRAIYNVSPDISRSVSLFGNAQYNVARFMLNECYGDKYTENDVAANFMCALSKFARDVKTYDKPLKAESPIGLITMSSRKNGFIDFFTDNVGGLLQQAIRQEFKKGDPKDFIKITESSRNLNQTLTVKLELTEDFVDAVIDNLMDKINANRIIQNIEACREFTTKLNTLIDYASNVKIGIIKNKMGTSEWAVRTQVGYDLDLPEVVELLGKLFNEIVKEVNRIGGKCFEIPYITYGSSPKVKKLIDDIRTKDIDQMDLEIFFAIFSVMYNDGTKDVFLPNASSIKQLDPSLLPKVRVNMKKTPDSSSYYLLENWLPKIPLGGKVYFNNDLNSTIIDEDSSRYVKEYFNKVMSTENIDDLGIFRQPCLDLEAFESAGYISIGDCLRTDVPVLGDTKTRLLKFISGKSEEKAGERSKYLGTVLFDNNDKQEAKILRASYNGWKLNKATGKYERSVNGKMVELDPSVDIESFYNSQCKSIGTKDVTTCTQLMEKILVDDSSTKSIAEILNKANFAGSFASGRMRDIHPKLAKKILKNLGFKEVQFTTRLGTKVNIIEPYQNWLNRFVKSNKDLVPLYNTLNSESGAELRLFLKLLIKAVNDEKTMGVLSTKEKVELAPDYSTAVQERARMEKVSRDYGIPIYSGKPKQKPALSLEEIRRGFGYDIDSLGLKLDSDLNFMNAYNDFNTISMNPFLFIINKSFPGINITAPYRYTNTRGSMTGGAACADYDGAEIDVDSGFDLKSRQLRNTWNELNSQALPIDPEYKQNLEAVVQSVECGEASLLLNLARIKKLSELIKAEPSILADTGDRGLFTRDEIATIAKTFNQKMEEYTKRLNKGFDLLSNLENRAVLGEIELSDIVV